MATPLLAGVRVVDLAGEPAAAAGRILADLGADVVVVEPPEGVPLRTLRHEWAAWGAGKRSVVVDGPDDPRVDALLADADLVIDTPGFPEAWVLDPRRAPRPVWVHVTPFGAEGPRSRWRASDLGVMAASGNMWATGDPDRAPVRCTKPSGYAHTGAEVAFAALSALWAADGHGGEVDCSMQEIVFVANMDSIAQYAVTGNRGQRLGANMGRTREIWRTRDGFVSYGVRGGAARLKNWAHLADLLQAEDVPGAVALTKIDWTTFNNVNAEGADLDAIQAPLGEWFARHTNQELYDLACEHNLFLAPVMSPREMFANAQLCAREFFTTMGIYARFPQRFVVASSSDGEVAPAAVTTPAPELGSGPRVWNASPAASDAASAMTDRSDAGSERPRAGYPGEQRATRSAGVWSDVKILEFGSGAAGPISTRYFVEHGATVLRVESSSRPDFLRVMALGPHNPHGLEGASLYDVLNVGKYNATFNLKDARAVDLVRRLAVVWADAVVENFAPRAMKGFGLDYASLAEHKPDLVMVSACLNGQTGPHKDYPGFGSQGSALAGFTFVTGWPDREPVGPYGTITDSLAPRYVATALAAGLHYRRRTGHGVYLDLSQVECGIYALSPWLLAADKDGTIEGRAGNRSPRAVPHGAFRCADETDAAGSERPRAGYPGEQRATDAAGTKRDDRWIAIACWTDHEWATLAHEIGIDDPSLATFDARVARIAEVEAAVGAWTRTRPRIESAERLQGLGIEAVPVNDFGDIHDDPQVAYRRHFVALTHPFMGPRRYEHNGFRVAGHSVGYDRAGPTLGQDNDWVQGELLGLSVDERATLADDGVFT